VLILQERACWRTGTITRVNKHLLKMDLELTLAKLAGFLSLALGAVVLLGWYLHEPALIQVNPAFVPMQYNTALGFAVGGFALLGLAWYWPRFAGITAVIVLLTGVLTLIEYSFGVDLHIDQLFMEHYIDLKTSNPGRMAPNTALCFSLTGLAVLLTTLFHERARITAWTATLGALIISLGIVALAGYMIGVEGAYGWGHMTRMAIHTAAGFIILGIGFVAHAWSRNRLLSPDDALPRWVPQVIAITGLTITFAMWQALSAQEQRMVGEMGVGAANFSDEGLLAFGILLTLTLAVKARAMARASRAGRRTGPIYAPYVIIALGALLAASLYSLLHTSFESSVKQRFEAAALNHTEAIEHGIDAYLETLYNIRSGFDASSFVDRNEFRILVTRSLERNPGIRALEWVPGVAAQERDAMEATAREDLHQGFVIRDNHIEGDLTPAPRRDGYFPIYYVEPQDLFLPVLGFDLASRPNYRATLIKAARINAPVVSSRLQLMQSEEGTYAVFVALPVYRKDVPLNNADEREAALRGFAVLVTEIGPMISTILNKSTSPAGLSLTFTDTGASDDKSFMYRHVSRMLDPGEGNREADYPDAGLTSTTVLAFADRNWEVTAHAVNKKSYPNWDAGNFWLPLGVLLLSLGLAWFLYRSAQREQERARLLAFQKALLDSIPNPIFVKNVDAVFTACNKAYEKAFGINRDDFIGKTVMDLEFLPEDRRRIAQDDDVMLIRDGGYSQKETDLVYADGNVHNVMYWRTTFELADGVAGGMIGGFFDITELKSLQADLEQARDDADTANQAKSAFLANMSHELRTPMNAILGYSEMLTEEAEDLGQEEFIPDLKKINQAGTHLLALINDVLDLSKIESGKMEAFPEPIDLNSLIDDVSTTAQPLMGKNGNKLAIERAGQLGSAHQDLTKLRQALFNLLSNAAKFTHDGTVTLHVNRSEQAGVDWLSLAVSDTGIGIAADKLEHVFEEFAQADESTTRDYGGTGLGLAISQRFCQLLGGDLSVHSKLGEGSTFTIRVPAILPGSTPQQPTAETSAAITEAELGTLRAAGPGSMVLVIDDDPEACEIIERYLVKDGFNVITAASGEQGLRLAHELQPAAITLDVMMPEMDGWSVLRALKADPGLRKIPVIMLTMIDDRTRGYSLGAVDYLTKPVDREQLHKTLSRYYCDEDVCPVLLVEDDAETREIMARTLEKAGWTVSGAGNGQEALDVMEIMQPRLILLDLMMPVMDGFGFLAALRARPEWQHIPVIVVTAKDLTEDDRNRLSGVVEEVLEKSAYTRDQLLEHIREAVAACNLRGDS
jgi:PAS domain S-box-containing protein